MCCKTAVISCRLTNGQAVVSNSDGGGPHWHAAGQAAQHRLNRVAFGFLAEEHHLLLQLHRFKLDVTPWKRLKKVYIYMLTYRSLYSYLYMLFLPF